MSDLGRYTVTVAETPAYLVDAQWHLMDEDQRQLSQYLSINPEGGEKAPGFDNLRILEWKCENRSSKKDVYIIYFYYNLNIPIYLISLCESRHEAQALIKAEAPAMAELVEEIINSHVAQKGRPLKTSGDAA